MSATRAPLVMLWRGVIVAAYAARPLSCAAVLNLEPRDPAKPYASIDPHGFGVLGAIGVALLFALPVLWLTLQRRPAPSPPARGDGWRTAAVLLVLGTPMLLQLTYAGAPLAWSWPVYAASLLWFAVLASACFNRGTVGPSVHGAFDRNRPAAWGVVATIAAAKLAVLPLAFPDWRELF